MSLGRSLRRPRKEPEEAEEGAWAAIAAIERGSLRTRPRDEA